VYLEYVFWMFLQFTQSILRFTTYDIIMVSKALLAGVALMIIAIGATVATAALLSDQQTIHNNGSVTSSVDISVYSDSSCTNLCTSIDWGTLDPGDTASRTIYVKNTGNTTETINLLVSDWNPTKAANLMTVSWNKEGSQLLPNATVAATLTLSTQQDMGDIVNFDFNIIVKGSA
jgi:uncharacterized repeat protein (TIGR01451 family)